MIDRGKLVILSIFSMAVAAAAFAWHFRMQSVDRILPFWGSEAAILIRDAPRVEILRLQQDANGSESTKLESLTIDQRPIYITDGKEISGAPGLLHARQALLEDASFSWGERQGPSQPRWHWALRFTDGARRVTIAFDASCQHARFCEKGRHLSPAPIAAGMCTFITEQFPTQ